jgi:hypothetical protein
MKIFYIVGDCGRVEFCDSEECIDFLFDEETGREEYWDAEWGSFEAPGGITFDNKRRKVLTIADLRSEASTNQGGITCDAIT